MCNQWLGGWRVPFPGILGGFETHQKQFFAYFWSQEKNQKKKNFQEKSVFIRKNRRFFADFFFSDFSIPISFLAPPKSDFSPKNRPKSAIFLSMPVGTIELILYFTDTRVLVGTTELILILLIREYPWVLQRLIRYRSTHRY